jgi:CRP/FNR family transcriptional regulator, cyclic AMP receptor protein
VSLSTGERQDWLARVPLFRDASPESLMRVAEATGELTFEAGQHIVQKGQIGNGLYIVVSGRVSVRQGAETLARLGPGDFFGELTVIDQRPRSASVVADEPTTCLALASWDLLALLRDDPRLALNLLTELAGRLRATMEHLRH